MRRAITAALAALALAAVPGGARAQFVGYGYPGGYGGWGWSQWGADPGAGYMAGLGSFARGKGSYEVSDAQARAINADTAIKWNKALRERQRALRAERQVDDARRAAELVAQAKVDAVHDGSTLNDLLDRILAADPTAAKAAAVKVPLAARDIRDIPFESDSEALTICLDQFTGRDAWPVPLSEDRFAEARDGLRGAVEAALAEDRKGEVSPEAIAKLSAAIDALRDRFHKTTQEFAVGYDDSDEFLRTLAGLTKALQNPMFRQIVAGLDTYEGGTLGDLIGFMHAFNLRFGPAVSDRQRAIYADLVPKLAGVLDQSSDAPARRAVDADGAPLREAAREAFKGMGWPHLAGPSKPE